MVQLGLVKTTMDVLYKPECGIAQLLVMLLVNLTQLDAGVASVLQVRAFIYLNTIFKWEKCLCFRLFINSFVGMMHTYDHRTSYEHLKS